MWWSSQIKCSRGGQQQVQFKKTSLNKNGWALLYYWKKKNKIIQFSTVKKGLECASQNPVIVFRLRTKKKNLASSKKLLEDFLIWLTMVLLCIMNIGWNAQQCRTRYTWMLHSRWCISRPVYSPILYGRAHFLLMLLFYFISSLHQLGSKRKYESRFCFCFCCVLFTY